MQPGTSMLHVYGAGCAVLMMCKGSVDAPALVAHEEDEPPWPVVQNGSARLARPPALPCVHACMHARPIDCSTQPHKRHTPPAYTTTLQLATQHPEHEATPARFGLALGPAAPPAARAPTCPAASAWRLQGNALLSTNATRAQRPPAGKYTMPRRAHPYPHHTPPHTAVMAGILHWVTCTGATPQRATHSTSLELSGPPPLVDDAMHRSVGGKAAALTLSVAPPLPPSPARSQVRCTAALRPLPPPPYTRTCVAPAWPLQPAVQAQQHERLPRGGAGRQAQQDAQGAGAGGTTWLPARPFAWRGRRCC